MDVSSRADEYASGKAVDGLTRMIAKAYLDGYRDGYKDKEMEVVPDLDKHQPSFIDLGLPSKTLWSADYLKDDDEISYFTFEEASQMALPTEKQWNELKDNCVFRRRCDNNRCYAEFIGLNGNVLCFDVTGLVEGETLHVDGRVHFWLSADGASFSGNYCSSAWIRLFADTGKAECRTDAVFVGYGLPVRLVGINL